MNTSTRKKKVTKNIQSSDEEDQEFLRRKRRKTTASRKSAARKSPEKRTSRNVNAPEKAPLVAPEPMPFFTPAPILSGAPDFYEEPKANEVSTLAATIPIDSPVENPLTEVIENVSTNSYLERYLEFLTDTTPTEESKRGVIYYLTSNTLKLFTGATSFTVESGARLTDALVRKLLEVSPFISPAYTYLAETTSAVYNSTKYTISQLLKIHPNKLSNIFMLVVSMWIPYIIGVNFNLALNFAPDAIASFMSSFGDVYKLANMLAVPQSLDGILTGRIAMAFFDKTIFEQSVGVISSVVLGPLIYSFTAPSIGDYVDYYLLPQANQVYVATTNEAKTFLNDLTGSLLEKLGQLARQQPRIVWGNNGMGYGTILKIIAASGLTGAVIFSQFSTSIGANKGAFVILGDFFSKVVEIFTLKGSTFSLIIAIMEVFSVYTFFSRGNYLNEVKWGAVKVLLYHLVGSLMSIFTGEAPSGIFLGEASVFRQVAQKVFTVPHENLDFSEYASAGYIPTGSYSTGKKFVPDPYYDRPASLHLFEPAADTPKLFAPTDTVYPNLTNTSALPIVEDSARAASAIADGIKNTPFRGDKADAPTLLGYFKNAFSTVIEFLGSTPFMWVCGGVIAALVVACIVNRKGEDIKRWAGKKVGNLKELITKGDEATKFYSCFEEAFTFLDTFSSEIATVLDQVNVSDAKKKNIPTSRIGDILTKSLRVESSVCKDIVSGILNRYNSLPETRRQSISAREEYEIATTLMNHALSALEAKLLVWQEAKLPGGEAESLRAVIANFRNLISVRFARHSYMSKDPVKSPYGFLHNFLARAENNLTAAEFSATVCEATDKMLGLNTVAMHALKTSTVTAPGELAKPYNTRILYQCYLIVLEKNPPLYSTTKQIIEGLMKRLNITPTNNDYIDANTYLQLMARLNNEYYTTMTEYLRLFSKRPVFDAQFYGELLDSFKRSADDLGEQTRREFVGVGRQNPQNRMITYEEVAEVIRGPASTSQLQNSTLGSLPFPGKSRSTSRSSSVSIAFSDKALSPCLLYTSDAADE